MTSAIAVLATATLLATTALVQVAQAAPKPSGPPPPPAVATPAAATLPEVLMTCTSSQTDVNSASVTQLMLAFGIDSSVANRLVGFRPFLAVSDILVVQGIGPDKLRTIVASGRGCAAPVSTPPPAPSPCNTTSKVDLQSATADKVAQVTGVNKNAAAAVVAARPFASLSHVTPERVPGVGKGILDTVVSRSCLTPQPVRDAVASWRWAYPAYSTTVKRDLYALSIPVGVVDSSSGAWASVTPTLPIDPVQFGLVDPTADMHIWGQWADGTQAVIATLPPAPYLDKLPSDLNWVPLIKHQFSDGSGDGENLIPDVNATTGQVSAPLTSLSFLSSIFAIKDFVSGLVLGNRFSPPACPATWTHSGDSPDYFSPSPQKTHVVLKDSQLNMDGNLPTPLGFLMLHCVGTGEKLNDNLSAALTILRNNSGAVYRTNDGANNVSNYPDDKSSFLHFLTDTSMFLTNLTYGGSGALLGPGDRVNIQTPAGSSGLTYVKPDVGRTVMNLALNATFGGMLDAFRDVELFEDPTLRSKIVNMIGCVYDVFQSLGEGDSLTQYREAVHAGWDCVMSNNRLFDVLFELQLRAAKAGAGADTKAGKLIERAVSGVYQANKLLQFAKVGAGLADLVAALSTKSDFRADHFKPNPTVDSKRRRVQAHCLRDVGTVNPTYDMSCQDAYYASLAQVATGGGGGDAGMPAGIITRDLDHHAFFANFDAGSYSNVDSGAVYNCLARAGYPVKYATEPTDLGFEDTHTNAACPVNPPSFMVDQAQMDSVFDKGIRLIRTVSDEMYLYKGNGVLSQVLGEDQLNCWATGAHGYLAYDAVPDAVISEKFDYHPEYVDYCVE